MKKLVLGLSIFLAHIGVAQDIDLVQGTLNAQPLCGMTLDELTSSLGRPSGARGPTPILEEFQGPTLFWHHLGVKAEFRPGTTGEELINMLTIYVVRVWDSANSQWFQKYQGVLNPGADGNWRVDRTLEEVAELDPEVQTPEQQEEWMLANGFPEDLIEPLLKYEVRVRSQEFRSVVFYHEPITRFLEDISFGCPRF